MRYNFRELVTGSERSGKEAYFAYKREMKGKMKSASIEANRRHAIVLYTLRLMNGDVGQYQGETFRERVNKKLMEEAYEKLKPEIERDMDWIRRCKILKEGIFAYAGYGATYEIKDGDGKQLFPGNFNFVTPTGRKPTEFYGNLGNNIYRFDIDTREVFKLSDGNSGLGFVRLSKSGCEDIEKLNGNLPIDSNAVSIQSDVPGKIDAEISRQIRQSGPKYKQ